MAKLRVGVLLGGQSGEHEVSLVSGRAVLAALDRKKYQVTPILIGRDGRWRIGNRESTLEPVPARRPPFDVILPILHGPFGEDGTIQGLLELAGIPYAGAGVLGSAVAMDKDVMKRLFQQAGLPIVPYCRVGRAAWERTPRRVVAELERCLRYPLFVKPANLGSSVGISKVHRRAELGPALTLAARYDAKLVVEQGVEARELECAVLGNAMPEASVVGEVVAGREFYDYQAKYADAGSRTLVPARIPARVARQARQMALAAFAATECEGLARVDFFLEESTGKLLVNEINSMPGFTPISMFPMLWAASGLPFPALVDRIVALALERAQERRRSRASGGSLQTP